MSSDDVLDIGYLAPSDAEDFGLMSSVTGLINEVYEVAEKGLWVDGTTRTAREEVETFTRSQEIAVARIGGDVVGCVRVQRLDQHVSEFGMLAAAIKRRGIGIGRELVQFAERDSQQNGFDIMQLELLVPREWSHPSKVFLNDWYTRIGYEARRTGSVDEFYPELAPLLATTCDFIVYHKTLRE